MPANRHAPKFAAITLSLVDRRTTGLAVALRRLVPAPARAATAEGITRRCTHNSRRRSTYPGSPDADTSHSSPTSRAIPSAGRRTRARPGRSHLYLPASTASSTCSAQPPATRTRQRAQRRARTLGAASPCRNGLPGRPPGLHPETRPASASTRDSNRDHRSTPSPCRWPHSRLPAGRWVAASGLHWPRRPRRGTSEPDS